MSYWDILNLEPTNDIRAIKRRYAELVKLYHPEDDPEGFAKLREAYESALRYAKYAGNATPEYIGKVDSEIEVPEVSVEDVENTYALFNKMKQLCLTNETNDEWQTFLNSSEFLKIVKNEVYQIQLYYFLVSEKCLSKDQAELLFQTNFKCNKLNTYLLDVMSGDIMRKEVSEEESIAHSNLFGEVNNQSLAEDIELVLKRWKKIQRNFLNRFRIAEWQELFRTKEFQRIKYDVEFIEELYGYLLDHHFFGRKVRNLFITEFDLESLIYQDYVYKYLALLIIDPPKQIKIKKRKKIFKIIFTFYFIWIAIVACSSGKPEDNEHYEHYDESNINLEEDEAYQYETLFENGEIAYMGSESFISIDDVVKLMTIKEENGKQAVYYDGHKVFEGDEVFLTYSFLQPVRNGDEYYFYNLKRGVFLQDVYELIKPLDITNQNDFPKKLENRRLLTHFIVYDGEFFYLVDDEFGFPDLNVEYRSIDGFSNKFIIVNEEGERELVEQE